MCSRFNNDKTRFFPQSLSFIYSSRRGQTQWKYKMKSMDTNGKPVTPQESQSPRPQTKLSTDMSPALIAQANWTFVEKLLKVLASLQL